MEHKNIWVEIMELAKWSPTPHNTQPLRLKIINETTAEVYYDLARALPEGDPSARFAFTAIGIFVEACKIAAAKFGRGLTYEYLKEPLRNRDADLQNVGTLTLGQLADKNTASSADLLLARRTNRLPYNDRKVEQVVIQELQAVAAQFGHSFHVREDPPTVSWVNKLNQRMVFYDLDEDNVRHELASWSRFSKRSAARTQDGLSAECLHVPGSGLWVFMKHYGLLHIPGIRQILQWIYTKNAQDITTVAWLEGPFMTIDDYLKSGHALLHVWLTMAAHGIAYQPYGSVITNARAHKEFVDYLKIDESHTMAWLLMRIGYSDEQPPRSKRLETKEYFV